MTEQQEPKNEKRMEKTYGSPGPIYTLPSMTGNVNHDPRSYYPKNPAYSLGSRKQRDFIDSSPGPVYKPSSKLLRTGVCNEPRATVVSRPKDENVFNTPGPCLGLESENRSKGAAYSFGHRGRIPGSSDSPGPATYKVPSTMSRTVESDKKQAPHSSIKSRTKTQALQDSPGPGTYKVPPTSTYSNAPPAVSVKGRHKELMDSTGSPGPAQHLPTNYTRTTAPKYSFGSKHSPYVVPLIVPA